MINGDFADLVDLAGLDADAPGSYRVTIAAPDGSGTVEGRRIRLELREPTHDGNDTLDLLTTVPTAAADACTLARIYRERWTLEKPFCI